MDYISLGRFVIEDYYADPEFEKGFSIPILLKKHEAGQKLTSEERGYLIFKRALLVEVQSSGLEAIPVICQFYDDWENYRSRQEIVESQILEPPPNDVPVARAPSPVLPMDHSELKKLQISFLKRAGSAFYSDVFPHTAVWLRNQVTGLLGNVEYRAFLIDRLAGKKPGSSQAPSVNSPLWEVTVADQTLAMLQGLATTFGRIIASPELRLEFKNECAVWLKGASYAEEIASALQIFGPDVALAFVKSLLGILQQEKNKDLLKTFSHSLSDFVHKKQPEQIRLLLQLVLEKAIAEPFEAATETFFAKFFDSQVCEPLFKSLEKALLAPFFPAPENFPAMQRQILIRLMEGFTAFLKGLNDITLNIPDGCKNEKDRVAFVVNGLGQRAINHFPSGVVPPRGADPYGTLIRHLMGELIKQFVEDPQVRDKLEFGIPLIANIAMALFDVPTLDILLSSFVKHPTTFYNPFEADPEPLQNFDNSDAEFNKAFAQAAAPLARELIAFCETNIVVKKIIEAALSIFLPKDGEPVQRALNRLSQSGTRFLPVIAATKMCWVIPMLPLPKESTKAAFDEHGRACLRQGLAEGPIHKRERAIDFEKLMNQSPEQQQEMHEATRRMVLGTEKETELLRRLVNSITRISSAPLETVQKFYRYAEHTPFWRALLITLLYHLTKKKDHVHSSTGSSPPAAAASRP